MQSTLRGKDNRIGIICCCMLCLLLACCSLLLSSCGEEQKPKGRMVQVNYLSSDETGIEIHEYDKPSGDALEQVRTLMNYLGATPENLAFKSPLAMGFQVLGVEYQDGSLVLNVDEEYLKLSATTEVLVRAAIVRTLLQADGVSRMQILVAGNQLMDAAGEQVGWMTADQFIHNDGSEINTYEQVRGIFTEKSSHGLRAEMKAILAAHNLQKLSDAKEDQHLLNRLAAEAEAIQNA